MSDDPAVARPPLPVSPLEALRDQIEKLLESARRIAESDNVAELKILWRGKQIAYEVVRDQLNRLLLTELEAALTARPAPQLDWLCDAVEQGQPFCGEAQSPQGHGSGYVCNRPPAHRGPHVATADVAVWVWGQPHDLLAASPIPPADEDELSAVDRADLLAWRQWQAQQSEEKEEETKG